MTSEKNFNKSRIRQLLVAYVTNSIPRADYNELMDYVQEARRDTELHAFMEQLWNAQPITQPFTELESKVLYQQILSDKRFTASPKPKIPVYKMWYGIAASLVLISLITMLMLNYRGFFKEKEFVSKNIIKNDIPPGTQKAVLTLGNGIQVELTAAGNDSLMRNSENIVKAADGQLVYQQSGKTKVTNYNTIETPRGGQYQIILPDGTKVWLNSFSRIKYPESFAGLSKRAIELSGEAYFEVSHNRKQPFIVRTENQTVEVLGTHFNVNSYADENETRTTLVEGSVKVSKKQDKDQQQSLTLIPGQQAVLTGGIFNVEKADLEAATAWKDGYFIFKDESLQSIMRKISRWYDVEVTYSKNIPDKRYEGSISRFKNVSEILRKFELTEGIHFKVEGRRVTVMP
jgi:ferric-dicitrate binding protein FerR (iron transport regulator)